MRVGDFPPGTTWPLKIDDTPALLTCTVHGERQVILTEERWFDHVLDGHDEMADKLPYVEWCLTRPDMINRDAWDPQRECYYVEHISTKGRRGWIKVVVHFDQSVRAVRGVHGYVVTAFVSGRIKRKEDRLWP